MLEPCSKATLKNFDYKSSYTEVRNLVISYRTIGPEDRGISPIFRDSVRVPVNGNIEKNAIANQAIIK